MSFVVRLHSYVAGNVILAQYHNVNENTLYNVINGNLNDDNMESGSTGLTESAVYFKIAGAGHMHDGVAGTGGSKINLSQTDGGDGYLMNLDCTSGGHGLTCASNVTTKAGIYGLGKASDAYGGKFENNSGGHALYATTSAGGSCGIFDGPTGGFHTLRVQHNSTVGTPYAGLLIDTVADVDHYGIWINKPEGMGIWVDRTGGTDKTKNSIQIDHDGTNEALNINTSGTGAGIDVYCSAGAAINTIQDSTTGQNGIFVNQTGVTGVSTGLRVTNASAAGRCAVFSGGYNGAVISEYTGTGISMTNSNNDIRAIHVLAQQNNAGGTGSGHGWLVEIHNTAGTPANKNSLFVEGRSMFLGNVQINGTMNGAGKFFIQPVPDNPTRAYRYACVEAPENLILWRARVDILKPSMGEEPAVVVPLPKYVGEVLSVEAEFDVFVNLPGAWGIQDGQEIKVWSPSIGTASVMCLGTRRYWEDHEPEIDYDWSTEREQSGTQAYRAYGPNEQ